MNRRVILVLRAVGVVAVVATLGAQIVVLPPLASSLAAAYPEAAHLRVPMLVFSVMCLVPIQVAAVLSGVLAWNQERVHEFGTGGARAASWLGAMALALGTSAALGLAMLVWAGVQTAEFGMQPGIALALIMFSAACLAAAGFVWRGRRWLPNRDEQPPTQLTHPGGGGSRVLGHHEG
jgi:hypothetical protein